MERRNPSPILILTRRAARPRFVTCADNARSGVTKGLSAGRQMKSSAPPKRRSWIATMRPASAAPDFNPSPWSGYAASCSFF